MLNQYASETARALDPYVPGEQPRDGKLIKLNTNENAFPPSPEALEAIRREMGKLRLYSDPNAADFVEAIAERENLSAEWVFPGNGSDEVLAFAFQAFFNRGQRVLAPQVSYSFYPVYASLYGVELHEIPMREGLSIDAEDYKTGDAVVIANPNAPTGRALPLRDIEALCAFLHEKQRLLLVDEAYVDFGAESASPLLSRYDNLLIVRTLSKSHALAGLRLGYALGNPALIEALNAVKNSFNSYTLDRLAITGGAAALRDEAYFEKNRDLIMENRERFSKELLDLDFTVLPSRANFVFAKHPSKSGAEVFAALRQRGILVRHFNRPGIADYLRISIGAWEDMQAVLDALGE